MSKPLFIWAGGKNKMLKHYLPIMPKQVDTYVEPFFGGGAMFCHIVQNYQPKKLVINDVNADIVRIYNSIKNNLPEFLFKLDSYCNVYLPMNKEDRKKYYFEVRHEHAYDYDKWSEAEEAATLYFLMKTGFNGIFQINNNTNRRYGTPAGLLNQKDKVYELDVVKWWNQALQNSEVMSGDWKECLKQIPDEDNAFVFLDPPYRDSFTSYGQTFGDDEQEKLIKYVRSRKLSTAFLCNRDAEDGWFEERLGKLIMNKFPVTYTAGRRKQTEEGFEAKQATEVLIRNK
jgi:DNA adenine methylase